MFKSLFAFVLILFSATAFAQTALTVATVTGDTPLDITTVENADSGSGNTAANSNGDVMFFFHNNGASSASVTITAQDTTVTVPGYGDLTKSDQVVSLSAGERYLAGPYPAAPWNNTSGQVVLNYGGAGAADVDVKAFRATGN